MLNFRKVNHMAPLQPSLSSYGNWVQEPHIDEEDSDAAEDNSSGENMAHTHHLMTYVNVQDQTGDNHD